MKRIEAIMKIVFLLAAIIAIIALLLIFIFLFSNGIPAIKKIGLFNFLAGKDWFPNNVPPSYGILPMIVGSVSVTLGSVLLAFPIGLLTAVYLARYCKENLYRVLKPAVELLAGVPSVVYGFFGMLVIVPICGDSMLSAIFLLCFMILPTLIGISEAAIKAVPGTYYDASLALGASHERAIFYTLIPIAKSGIFAAIVLGLGRAIGETMAVIMVIGNQARMPSSIMDGVRTMTGNIVLEMGYATDLHREALIATGVVLFVFILIINTTFAILKRRSL